jgi:N4-gp56 family major capsid protein
MAGLLKVIYLWNSSNHLSAVLSLASLLLFTKHPHSFKEANMPYVTTATLPSPVQQAFDAKILSTPVANYIHSACAVQKLLPKNAGPILRMRRYDPLAAAVVPLGDTGITPPNQQLTAVNIDARPQLYGTWIGITEAVTLTNADPVLNAAARRLGDSLRKTEDQLVRDMLVATAAIINCVNGVNGNIPTEMTAFDVSEVVRTLLGNNAIQISDSIEGSLQFGTAPVRQAYIGFAHTDMTGARGLDGVNGFIHKNAYPSSKNESRYSEWGSIGNTRFLVSSVGSKVVNGAGPGIDMYNIPICGQEAYATVKQDGYSAQFIYLPPQFSGPLALTCTLGWKMRTASRILNDLWVVNLRATLA